MPIIPPYNLRRSLRGGELDGGRLLLLPYPKQASGLILRGGERDGGLSDRQQLILRGGERDGGLIASSGATLTYQDLILNENPVAYWRLGEVSGSTAIDQTSNANNGTYTNGPTLGAEGLISGDSDTSVSFDGTDDHILVPRTASLNLTSAWTLEAWVYRTGASGGAGIIAELYNSSENNVQFELGLGISEASPQSMRLAVGYFSGSWKIAKEGVDLPLNTKQHVVGTWDGSTLRLYRNGSQVASSAQSGGPTSGTLDFAIGRRHATDASEPYFAGRIDEVAIYPASLSAQQITDHYNAGA